MKNETETSMVSNLVNTTSLPSLLSREKGIAFCIAFFIEMVAIIIGNSIAIGAFTRKRRLRNQSFYLLVNLAVADLLVGAVSVSLTVVRLAKHFHLWAYDGGSKMDIVHTTITTFVEGASLMSLVMISFERMYAVIWPVKHRLLKAKVYYVEIVLVWCFSSTVPASFLARYCGRISDSAKLVIWLSFLSFCLLLIFINYLIIWIKCKFWKPINRMASARRERRLVMSLFLITIASMVTILPAPITHITFHYFSPESLAGCFGTCRLVYMSTVLLFYAKSLVNPIIYTFRIPEFKDYAVQLICRRSFDGQTEAIEMRDL